MDFRLSVQEPENKETWRAIDDAAAEEFKKSSYGLWDYGAGEAIRNSKRVLRVSVYEFEHSSSTIEPHGLYLSVRTIRSSRAERLASRTSIADRRCSTSYEPCEYEAKILSSF